MTKIKSRYKVAKYKNGLPHYGEVILNIELTENNNWKKTTVQYGIKIMA